MDLMSHAFAEGQAIPRQYTCDGEDISPELSWRNVPEGTQSFVLIVDDPDAPNGTWDHWLLYNIPSDIRGLAEAIKKLPAGTQVGKNSWGRTDYGGPCPPDREHRYVFKLYALDTVLKLPDGADKKQIETMMMGHILAETSLMGRYDRS